MGDGTGEWPRSPEAAVTVDAGVDLKDEDWQQIDNLLDSDSPAEWPGPSEESISAVVLSLAELRTALDDEVLPAGPLMNRVIDVWDLAHQVGPEVAKPAESLLTSLVGRDLVSARDVTNTCDQIEATLAAIRNHAVGGAPGGWPRQRTGSRASRD
jgi:hypothetical protein